MTRAIEQRVAARFKLAMVAPPRFPLRYVKETHAKLKKITEGMVVALGKLDSGDNQYYLSDVCRGFDSDLTLSDFENANTFMSEAFGRVDRTLSILQYKADKYDVMNRLKALKEATLGPIRGATTPNLSQVAEVAKDKDVPPDLVKHIRAVLEYPAEFLTLYENLVAKLQALVDIENPQHENVEKLYHASIHARDLLSSGFSHKRPEGGGFGLGGDVSDEAGNPAISFTYDQKYALEIARWLKELAMVAQGNIKPNMIMDWADREGIAEEVFNTYTGLYGARSKGDPFKGGRTDLEFRNGKWRVLLKKFDRALNDLVESVGYIDDVIDTKEKVYGLYLSFLSHNKHRENPVFMETEALLKRLESVDPRDIGVITAEVDMTDPDIASYPAEREFRVPVRAIRKILKFV